jgi:hypothetical protein
VSYEVLAVLVVARRRWRRFSDYQRASQESAANGASEIESRGAVQVRRRLEELSESGRSEARGKVDIKR